MIENAPVWLQKAVIALADQWPWLAAKINAMGINGTVNVCRHRPHPWSTVHEYVSWTSLTDQRWSARHLPAKDLPNLPPPEELIGLFRRPTGEQRFCSKSTCLFPAFAQYLTDGFIRTRMPTGDEPESVRRENTSNHQIDLCPLYGRTPEQTHALRLKSEAAGRRGRLKSQIVDGEEYAPFLFQDDGTVKSEFLILDPPLGLSNFPDPALRARIFAFGGDRANSVPQVAMMNTLFLREHNRLAAEIERSQPGWDDERVFQTARNAVIVLFIKIVVEEYINHISPQPFRLRAEPSVAWDAPWNKTNWITTEFSLLYRWHSLVPDTITWNERNYPVHTTFMDNRLLIDAGLARAFADMSAQRAGQIGPFNTADALVEVEKRAIEQGRLCRLAPYSDYRKYVTLKQPGDYEDVSRDGRVVDFLRDAYKNCRGVEDVDFYIGLFAEDTVKNSPLPPLILRMVAVDAFSQALTNPLLSRSVFQEEDKVFSKPGWEAIESTHSLRDLLDRNSPEGVGDARISMTSREWKYRW
jgi:prostaglandin-endoperoxide synthase 2